MVRVVAPLLGLCVGLCISCRSLSPNLETLKTRAAFDLQCRESELELTSLSPEVYGVVGCGKRATYVNGPRSFDDWIMNTEDGKASSGPGEGDGD